MNNKAFISSGQLFILLFVCKISELILLPLKLNDSGYVGILFPSLMILSVISFIAVVFSDYCKRNQFTSDIKAIAPVMSIFFIYSLLFHLYIFSDFIVEITGNSIPALMLLFLLFSAAAYGAVKGIEAIARFSAIVFVSILIASALYFIFLYPSFMPDTVSLKNEGSLTNGLIISVPLCEELAFLFILSGNTKGSILRSGFIWNCMQTIFIAALIILIGGAIGEYLTGIPFPFFHASDGSGDLQRFRPFLVSVTIASVFCTLSVELYIIRGSVPVPAKIRIKNPSLIIFSLLFGIYLIFSGIPSLLNTIYDSRIMAAVSLIFVFILPSLFVLFQMVRRKILRPVKIAGITAFIISASLVLCSCNARQLNQRIIVQGIGIDKNENDYRVTLIALDTDTQESENSVKLIYSDGEDVKAALTAVENRQGRKLMLSQCLFIMLNSSAAADIESAVSFFTGNNEIMKTTNIMTADNTDELLTKAITGLGYTSENINVLSDSNAINQRNVHFSLFDYISSRKSKKKEIIIPHVVEDKETSCLRTDRNTIVSANQL